MSEVTKETDLWGNELESRDKLKKKKDDASKKKKDMESLPDKLGKAIKLPVPDFNDPNRKLTCLEVDFPIVQINSLAGLEATSGAAKKPIYSMSKWWARRQSSVFRSLLTAAATEAPDDPNEAAKLVWDHYYCNHQMAGSFKKLKVLDCFMGGGTTLVEGSRLGMQMTGVDLNPVAWFVVKNELACSDPEQVKALFEEIEKKVKPQVQPFYTTTCPRGHKGKWIDVDTGEIVDIDPIDLSPEQRYRYRWEGPEVIYTFWAKHGHCQAKGCGHRTPIFRSLVIAEKNLSTEYLELTCPKCANKFHAELGETHIAPGAELIVLDEDFPFTILSQKFSKNINDYDKDTAKDTYERSLKLKEIISTEKGFNCPNCNTFSGKRINDIIEHHSSLSTRTNDRKKTAFQVKRKKVQLYLIINPKWMQGTPGFSDMDDLGGWAGASIDKTKIWYEKRLENLEIIELRSKSLPDTFNLPDGSIIEITKGTVPAKGKYVCSSCGRIDGVFNTAREYKKTLPLMPYIIQCHCVDCEKDGFPYGGKYFKSVDVEDINKLSVLEKEWFNRKENDLSNYWPREDVPFGERTTKRDSLHEWGYTHWWKMFNNRQLFVHAHILKAITEASDIKWPLDVREQVLGAFQQFLRSMSMFSFYHQKNDQIAAALSNPNFYPKNLVLETCVFNQIGSGRWGAYVDGVVKALKWINNPTEPLAIGSNASVSIDDPIKPGVEIYCGSSTDLSFLGNSMFDLIITDPPFADNLFYADLSDFFYAWLRIPLGKWYKDIPEGQYFKPEHTPRSLEAVDNSVEHPDERESYEKDLFIDSRNLSIIHEITKDNSLIEKDPNPLYRPLPSSDFYSQTLSSIWAEAGRHLNLGGIMAFTFHHSEDQAWIDVLKALFEADYFLLSTYPIRSDESKGENAAFGSQSIEYDIIHVCRKRLNAPEPVSWSRMRRWVKEEAQHLKELLEHTHGKSLPEADLRVILRGKSLEFYSRHYGQVLSGDGQVLDVRDALLGINQILDDILEDAAQTGGIRPPESAEPTSGLYLRIFKYRMQMERDELHKTLRGTGISQGDLESKGWIRVSGRIVNVVPISERFAYFTERGRNRKVIKTDLDQAHFLIGAALPGSGIKIEAELNNANFRIKKSVDDILKWYAEVDGDAVIRQAAKTSVQLVEHWRANRDKKPKDEQLSLFEILEETD